MSFPFEPREGLIKVRVRVFGPGGARQAGLRVGHRGHQHSGRCQSLRLAGYGLADEPQPVRVATGSQVETMARVTLSRFAALGEERRDFPVLVHELPPGMSVAGLLGPDFLRGHVLTIDFRAGQIAFS